MILFAFLCLTFEASAQFGKYTFMRRGQVSTYDSSVNIDLREYRKIRQKITLADSLIFDLNKERAEHESLIKEIIAKMAAKDEIIARHYETILAKETTIGQLQKVAEDCTTLARKLQIFPNPIADAGAKVGGGILIGLVVGILLTR